MDMAMSEALKDVDTQLAGEAGLDGVVGIDFAGSEMSEQVPQRLRVTEHGGADGTDTDVYEGGDTVDGELAAIFHDTCVDLDDMVPGYALDELVRVRGGAASHGRRQAAAAAQAATTARPAAAGRPGTAARPFALPGAGAYVWKEHEVRMGAVQ